MMLGIVIFWQVANSSLQPIAPIQAPAFVPPVTQTAVCVGVNDKNERQTITLESRWIPKEDRDAVFVRDDSSATLKNDDWLENQHSSGGEGDPKRGIAKTWDGASFSKRVAHRYVRIILEEVGMSSASILYVTRNYSEDERTALRFSHRGEILLAGRCTLFVNGAVRSIHNMPPIRPTE